MDRPPVETVSVLAEHPSQPATRHNVMADAEASTQPADTPRRTKRPGHLMGMATAHCTVSTRAPYRPTKLQQPASTQLLRQTPVFSQP